MTGKSVNDFMERSARQRRDYLMEEHGRLNSLCNTVLGAANTVAGKALYDAVEAVSGNRKVYRQGVKRNLRLAVASFRDYEKVHYRNMGDRYQLFVDYLDSVEELARPHTEMLEMQFRQMFLREKVAEPYMRAKVSLAMVTLELAVHIFDTLMREARAKTGYDYTPLFSRGRIGGPLFYFGNAAGTVLGEAARLRPSEDLNTLRAIRVLEKTLTSEDTFGRAGLMALRYNGELVGKSVRQEDYEMLASQYG